MRLSRSPARSLLLSLPSFLALSLLLALLLSAALLALLWAGVFAALAFVVGAVSIPGADMRLAGLCGGRPSVLRPSPERQTVQWSFYFIFYMIL